MTIKTLKVKKIILSANTEKADSIRLKLDRHRILMINIMSSPGSGKTTLLTETIKKLKDKYNIAVIEGDIASSIDSDRISRMGVPAIQINTGGGCHLDADMIGNALESLNLEKIDFIFIENVGNLVCPADFDLGAHKNAVILSVPEGDDKPGKYPAIFAAADAVLISKIDVMPYFDFDIDDVTELTKGFNPSAYIFSVSAKTGEGMKNWFTWIDELLI